MGAPPGVGGCRSWERLRAVYPQVQATQSTGDTRHVQGARDMSGQDPSTHSRAVASGHVVGTEGGSRAPGKPCLDPPALLGLGCLLHRCHGLAATQHHHPADASRASSPRAYRIWSSALEIHPAEIGM
ncbi:interleukin-18-binding protein isoform X3 [Taeniopygia guttata]|uniref:interleukin-18-binding protein isoform X3 n=1 Tax=Taeniopygia guttata TaxID=59729 RepID=UPI003BB87D04